MYTAQLDLSGLPDPSGTSFKEFWDLSQSTNTHILDDPAWQSLNTQITANLNSFFHDHLRAVNTVNLKITLSWINRYQRGQQQPRHFHSNSVFSGVVMLCDHPSDLVFYTPHRSNYRWNVTDTNIWNSSSWRMPCARGLLIVTPSVLDHETHSNDYDLTRWSLAFDTELEGDLDWVRSVPETLNNLSQYTRS